MKINFFEENNKFNEKALGAGVYQFKIGLLGEELENYLCLYVGESYSMAIRCSNHLYEIFKNDPSYFGFKEEYLKEEKLELLVEVYHGLNATEPLTNSERDILLRKKEKEAIETLKPLSQLETSDNLRPDRVSVVSAAIENLLKSKL